jgi:hypothetical protein
VTLPVATLSRSAKVPARWGEVYRTGYFHVLTLTVEDIKRFLREVDRAVEEKPGTLHYLS